MDRIKRFFSPLLYVKKYLPWIIFSGIWYGVNGVLMASAMKHIIDALEQKSWEDAKYSLIFMAVIYFFNVIFLYPDRVIGAKQFRNMQQVLYERYLHRFLISDNNQTDILGTGQTHNIVSKGIDNWANILWDGRNSINIVIGLVAAIIAIFSNIGLLPALIVMVLFVILFVINQFGNKSVAIFRKGKRDFITKVDRDFVRLIMSKTEILQNQKIDIELQNITHSFEAIKKLDIKEHTKRILSFDVQRLFVALIQVGLLSYLGWQVYQGNTTLGVLSMVWMLINQINNRLLDVNNFMTNFYQKIVFVQKLRDTFDDMPSIRGYDVGKSFDFSQGNIELQNIEYKYTKANIIAGLSAKIEGGKKTAFVGLSGGGKSTLIKLIAGYLHTTGGKVLIDGQMLPNEYTVEDKTVALKTYYPYIGYLTQEPNVFDGTVRENLLYGVGEDNIGEEKYRDILDKAQCQFVRDLPDGLDTQIGEKGIKLSGGQRQRLAIAKIFLKDPKIILLDEPTSALDSLSEEAITKALDNLFVGRTVIIVAHRLQTVKKADDIIVIDKGQILERGTHYELLKRQGQYAKMLELQSGF